MNYIIREAKVEDATNLLRLLMSLDTETPFSVYEEGERSENPFQIATSIATGVQRVWLAESVGQLVGYVGVMKENGSRARHRGLLSLGILKAEWNKGLGSQLLQYVDRWARDHDIRRIELSVWTQNEQAIELYKKSGYQIEGTRQQSILIDNNFENEHLMAKLY